jgi:hypothetical protein
MGEFHCGYGQVILDYLNVTPGTGPVYYTPEVWVYYSGAWHFYGYGQTETLYSSISFSSEWPIPVSVPHGYYYAVNVGVSSSGVTQTVSSYVDAGAPIVNAGYCAA